MSESRFETSRLQKTHGSGAVGCDWVVGAEKKLLGTLILEANTEMRHRAFSQADSAVKGWKGSIYQIQTWQGANRF